MLRITAFILACCSFVCIPTLALAENWPNRPITFIVPFPAGGSMDTFSRPIAKKLGETLGVPVVVSNRSGAGGGVGIAAIARSAPDGYTVGMSSVGNMAINPHIYASLPYDPLNDFTPIGLAGRFVNVLVVNNKVPAKNLQELIALANASPGSVTFASAGNGSTNHLSGEMLKQMTNSHLLHVPYRGSGPALMDVIAGNVTFMFDTLNTSMPHIESGDLRALAVTSAERSPFLPDVPTMNEAGITGYAKSGEDLWWAVMAPKNVPPDIQRKLSTALREALETPELQNSVKAQRVETLTSSSEELRDILKRDYARWKKIVQDSDIKIQ
jgi:tripartite-type tricarboxylate transporter receptor subunit TctC